MTQGNPADFIDRTVQKTNEWLRDITQHTGRDDPQKSYQMLRAVLHVLRDRLPVEAAAHVGAQLPMLIRGLYYEGWRPSELPSKLRSPEEFTEAVRAELSGNPEISPEQAIEATLTVLNERISEGEIDKIKKIMPEELRSIWPEGVRQGTPGGE